MLPVRNLLIPQHFVCTPCDKSTALMNIRTRKTEYPLRTKKQLAEDILDAVLDIHKQKKA